MLVAPKRLVLVLALYTYTYDSVIFNRLVCVWLEVGIERSERIVAPL
jgi:hypothetical protein